jgi:hypothetical protein
MWVESISFKMIGKNLRLDVKVISDSGALAGAQIGLNLTSNSGQSWVFNGITDSAGIGSFTVSKAPAGDYVATVTSLTAGSYTWDTERGVTSASYILNVSTSKPVKH